MHESDELSSTATTLHQVVAALIRDCYVQENAGDQLLNGCQMLYVLMRFLSGADALL